MNEDFVDRKKLYKRKRKKEQEKEERRYKVSCRASGSKFAGWVTL